MSGSRGLGLKEWLSGPRHEKTKSSSHEPEKQGSLDNHRMAILPFVNMSSDSNQDYFADGMTEELISTLSSIRELSVISRTSIMKFKGIRKTAGEIGQELKAGTLVEGSVRKWEDKIRITVQLIDAVSDKHLWSQTYDRKFEDIFTLQTDIAENIADNLKIKLVNVEKTIIQERHTGNLEAFNFYLQGRYYWNKRTEAGLTKAIEYFQKAIEIDPNYALAFSGIADSYLVLAVRPTYNRLETLLKAKQHALKALECNNLLPEAHASLGLCLENEWNWKGAEKEFKRAIELKPNYSTAHQWYALLLKHLGRFDEAIQEIKHAEESDPLSLIVGTTAIDIFTDSEQYDLAIQQARRLLELDPNFGPAHENLADVYRRLKMYQKGLEETEIVYKLEPNPFVKAVVTYFQVKTGQKTLTELKSEIDELVELSKTQYVSPRVFATFYMLLDDDTRMFEYLKKAFDEHDMQIDNFRFIPEFEPYRNDPRFTILMEKMGLPASRH